MEPQPTTSIANDAVVAKWSTQHSVVVHTLGDNQLIARVSISPDQTAMLLDIRRYIKNRPTTQGVAFFLPEVEWLTKMIQKRLEGSYDGKRKLIVTRIYSGIRILLVKAKGNTKEIVMTGKAFDNFASGIGDMYAYMDNFCQNTPGLKHKNPEGRVTCEARPWFDDEVLKTTAA